MAINIPAAADEAATETTPAPAQPAGALASLFGSLIPDAAALPEMTGGTSRPYLQTLSFAGNGGADRKDLADAIGVSEGALILRAGGDGVNAAGLAFVLLKSALYYGKSAQGEKGWGFEDISADDKSERGDFAAGYRRIFPYVAMCLPAKDALPDWAAPVCILTGHFTKQHAQAMAPVLSKMRSAIDKPDAWLKKHPEHAGVPVALRVAFGLTGKMKPGKKGKNAFTDTSARVFALGVPQATALAAAEADDPEALRDEIEAALEWHAERVAALDKAAAGGSVYYFDSE